MAVMHNPRRRQGKEMYLLQRVKRLGHPRSMLASGRGPVCFKPTLDSLLMKPWSFQPRVEALDSQPDPQTNFREAA